MKHVIILSAAVAAVACLYAAPTANEDFVVSEDARTYTNAVNAAKAYADMAATSAVHVAASAANIYTDAAVANLATNARDKADLAVYRKVGVGAAWVLVGDDGAITNNATGVFMDSGDGSGSWAFYIGSQLVAASYPTGTLYDYEIEWRGGREIGLAGFALRSFYGFQPTDDRLATTNGMAAYIDARFASLTPVVSAIVTNISDNWTGELGTLYKVLHENEWEGRLNQLVGGSSYRVVLDYVGSNVWQLMDDASGLDDLYAFAQGSAKARKIVFELAGDSMTATLLGTNKIELVRECLLSEYPRFEDVYQAIAKATNNIPRPDMSDYATTGQVFAVSNLAASAVHVESDPTVPNWAKSENKPSYSASEVGAYSSTSGNALAGQVATIGAHLNAEDARFVVTNYNSVTHTPEAYVEMQLPDESWSRIWSEMTRWNYLFNEYLPTNYYDKAAVNAALADKADRAWGFYDSTTGAYAPDGYTWISSEKIAIAANLAYQRTVTAEGAIWVLESNGVVTETGGMTNGFFRISDDEGNSLFEIVKGNKRTVGADASSCQVVAGFSPTKLQVGYSIVSDVHPTLYVCQSLATQDWKSETDGDCIANVTWSGTSGAYVAQVQGKSAYSSMFVKATYEVGGETYISNAAPVSMQYIMIGGVKYAVGVGTVSGTTVLTLTVAQ